MKRLLVAAFALVSSACVVKTVPGVGSLPGGGPGGSGGGTPGNSSSGISAGQAEAIALRIAADHGYSQAKAEKVHHDEGQGGRWKVEVRGLANGRDGKIDVRIADDGKVLDIKDHQKGDKGKDDDDKGKDKDKDKDKDDKGKGKDK